MQVCTQTRCMLVLLWFDGSVWLICKDRGLLQCCPGALSTINIGRNAPQKLALEYASSKVLLWQLLGLLLCLLLCWYVIIFLEER